MKWLSKHKQLLPEYIVKDTDVMGNYVSPFGDEYSTRTAREQVVWRFENDWGASVSCSSVTRFAPEFAVVRWHGIANDKFDLDYSTDITSDVISHVSVSELALLLARTRGLKRYTIKSDLEAGNES
jgi:hypothetical protein